MYKKIKPTDCKSVALSIKRYKIRHIPISKYFLVQTLFLSYLYRNAQRSNEPQRAAQRGERHAIDIQSFTLPRRNRLYRIDRIARNQPRSMNWSTGKRTLQTASNRLFYESRQICRVFGQSSRKFASWLGSPPIGRLILLEPCPNLNKVKMQICVLMRKSRFFGGF